MKKNLRYLERLVRGFSNHRRIQILLLLEDEPGLDLTSVARRCNINLKTAGEHVRRLAITGLVNKRAKGRSILHSVTPRGGRALQFLRSIEQP